MLHYFAVCAAGSKILIDAKTFASVQVTRGNSLIASDAKEFRVLIKNNGNKNVFSDSFLYLQIIAKIHIYSSMRRNRIFKFFSLFFLI